MKAISLKRTVGFLFAVLLAAGGFSLGGTRALAAIPDKDEEEFFEKTDTVVAGDFTQFPIGMKFANSSAETYNWGTNVTAGDYPAEVVGEEGNEENHILKIACPDKDKPYGSAFVFISSSFLTGDVMSVSFDYKLDVEDRNDYTDESLSKFNKDFHFSFASASNDEHHVIELTNTESGTSMTTGSNAQKWPVTYTKKENGWMNVGITLEVNAGTLVANSIRWLLPCTPETGINDALYVDNVEVMRWVDTRVEDLSPVLKTTEALTFNKQAAKDVTVVIDTKGVALNNIKRNGTNVNAVAYTKAQKGDECTVVLKSDYLMSLDEGEHKFQANTIEGSVEFTVKVVSEKSGKSGCGSSIGAVSGALAASVLVMGAALLLKKKAD